jgi:hypothetical protein
MNLPVSDIYESITSRLDQTNTQHFNKISANTLITLLGGPIGIILLPLMKLEYLKPPSGFQILQWLDLARKHFPLWGDNTATYINHSSKRPAA